MGCDSDCSGCCGASCATETVSAFCAATLLRCRSHYDCCNCVYCRDPCGTTTNGDVNANVNALDGGGLVVALPLLQLMLLACLELVALPRTNFCEGLDTAFASLKRAPTGALKSLVALAEFDEASGLLLLLLSMCDLVLSR